MTQYFLDLFASLGLPGIFILMTIESSFIPFPSEVVMIPAGMVVANGGYAWWAALLAGWLGSLAGAFINYGVGKYLGKPFFLKYGKYFFFDREKYDYSEELFQRNANLFTFLGRLIPGVRQLISIPAGIFGMNLTMFSILTFLGASIWSGFLIWLGYMYGAKAGALIEDYMHEFLILAVIGTWLFAVWIFLPKPMKQKVRGWFTRSK